VDPNVNECEVVLNQKSKQLRYDMMIRDEDVQHRGGSRHAAMAGQA